MVTHYGKNKFGYPTDVAIAPNGEVVIVDQGSRCVVVLDDKLDVVTVFGQEGPGRVDKPIGVAVTNSVIAVSDSDTHAVKTFSLQGKYQSTIGHYGNKDGQFNHPMGLAFNKNKKLLYVVDGDNFRVQAFKEDNSFSFSFGNRGSNPGEFQYPIRIAIDPNENVLVTDYSGNCIRIFSQRGELKHTLECEKPIAITVSPNGYLITSHAGDNKKIKVWSPIDQLVHQMINQFGRKGSEKGEFNNVQGIAIKSNGTIYITEADNERLQIIS